MNPTLNESIHYLEVITNGEYFLKSGRPCNKIGRLAKGVLRGFVYGHEGEEITTHFYQEGDMIIGSFIPNVDVSMTIQALEDCELSVANYTEVMSLVNKDPRVTEVVTHEFENLTNSSTPDWSHY